MTIFLQGAQMARLDACQYTGKEGLSIEVNQGHVEHVFNPEAPQLLYHLYQYPELNDVAYGYTLNPLHWCSKAINLLSQWSSNVYGTACVPYNKWSLVNLAGPEDVAQCINAIRSCVKEHPTKTKLVLFGRGRGAATLLVALTHLSQEAELLKYVRLVILEAPFASLPSLLLDALPGASTGLVPYMLRLLSFVTQYREEQMTARDAVESKAFPLHVPLLFVTSKKDRVVPRSNTEILIDALKQRQHAALHHLELKHSGHHRMALDAKEDQEAYHTEVHQLYRKYLNEV